MMRKRTGFAALLVLAVLFCFAFAAQAAAETNPEPYDRVIIFGVDAAGAMVQEVDMPNFDRIFGSGRVTYSAKSTLTISAPAWGAMFYGVSGYAHATTNDEAQTLHKQNVLYPSIFKLTKNAYPDAQVASYSDWHAINWGLIEWDIGVDIYPQKIAYPTPEEVESELLKYLDTASPKLLFVYFGEVDNALHAKGYGSKRHRNALMTVDGRIGRLYDEFEKRGLLENALVMFTTDHGGNSTGHGGQSEAEVNCTFAVAGPRLETEGTIGDMEVQDVAAIALYALGVDIPDTMTARVPAGIFPGAGGEARKESPIPELIDYYGQYQTIPDPEEPLSEALTAKLTCYQTFEGEKKIKGLVGKKHRTEGLIGSAMDLRDSSFKTGLRSTVKWSGMTISFWLKDDSDKTISRKTHDPVLVTDKNWKKGTNKGFTIAKLNFQTVSSYPLEDRIQICVADGSKFRRDLLWALPQGYEGKWVHVLAVFDPETLKVRLYIDFSLAAEAEMLPELHKNWVTGKEITAGQDITGTYKYATEGEMDELMVFNEALTDEEIMELKAWYDTAFEAAE